MCIVYIYCGPVPILQSRYTSTMVQSQFYNQCTYLLSSPSLTIKVYIYGPVQVYPE